MINLNKYLAELLGTAALLCAVIGSGIMAEKLANGNIGIALLSNTIATVLALYVLIEIFATISGAHFNPLVSLILVFRKDLERKHFFFYVIAQFIGAALGAWTAHLMFDLEVFQLSTKVRTGASIWFSEVVATAGLLFIILRSPKTKVSLLVACYIGSAYWFTGSTSFANPAATFGRMLTNTFTGIEPYCVPAFVIAELTGAILGLIIFLRFKPYGNEQ